MNIRKFIRQQRIVNHAGLICECSLSPVIPRISLNELSGGRAEAGPYGTYHKMILELATALDVEMTQFDKQAALCYPVSGIKGQTDTALIDKNEARRLAHSRG